MNIKTDKINSDPKCRNAVTGALDVEWSLCWTMKDLIKSCGQPDIQLTHTKLAS